MLIKDYTGYKNDRITVLECAGKTNAQETVWLCACSCGQKTYIRTGSITRTRSCGCLCRENGKSINLKHGERCPRTPEYVAWIGLKDRCLNPKAPGYPYYGGRGIKVCVKWRKSYACFLEDMGRKPSPSHSIDRINNNGPYAPSNCRWATKTQQTNNRRPMGARKKDLSHWKTSKMEDAA